MSYVLDVQTAEIISDKARYKEDWTGINPEFRRLYYRINRTGDKDMLDSIYIPIKDRVEA